MNDPQAAYEALVIAVEDLGYVVLMDVEGKISLVQTTVRPGDGTGRSSEILGDAR